ncbi:hypothetical protein ABGA94_01420, partial [Stenotrophomonas sp. 3diitr2024]
MGKLPPGSHRLYWRGSVDTQVRVMALGDEPRVPADVQQRLDQEMKQRQAEAKRLQTLEQALAGPLAAGRVTLVDGR